MHQMVRTKLAVASREVVKGMKLATSATRHTRLAECGRVGGSVRAGSRLNNHSTARLPLVGL